MKEGVVIKKKKVSKLMRQIQSANISTTELKRAAASSRYGSNEKLIFK